MKINISEAIDRNTESGAKWIVLRVCTELCVMCLSTTICIYRRFGVWQRGRKSSMPNVDCICHTHATGLVVVVVWFPIKDRLCASFFFFSIFDAVVCVLTISIVSLSLGFLFLWNLWGYKFGEKTRLNQSAIPLEGSIELDCNSL